ncbi:TPA: hypothetical protein ACGWER_002008 [Streptococcus agalactiae]|nr:hypothetical protein [Streptococcus agalactiae]HEO2267360.1 hypothetical protein [Streptococcus agalactiae]
MFEKMNEDQFADFSMNETGLLDLGMMAEWYKSVESLRFLLERFQVPEIMYIPVFNHSEEPYNILAEIDIDELAIGGANRKFDIGNFYEPELQYRLWKVTPNQEPVTYNATSPIEDRALNTNLVMMCERFVKQLTAKEMKGNEYASLVYRKQN